jgi:nucleotide-binding universal stress UspA family protein
MGQARMYKHVLISTDGSEIAQKGVDHGLDLAKASGARATIVAVIDTAFPYIAEAGGVNPVYYEYASIQRGAAGRILAAAADQARALGVEAETLCVEDQPPAQAIVETAQSRGCDVIAMSSHGRRGLRRMILGSVAAEVLATSPVPVLIVR